MPDDTTHREPEQVPSELYTHEYFITDCEGFDAFLEGGARLPGRIEEALDLAGDLRGKKVLDIGCGRGELVCHVASRGASAVGIDYADAAIQLAGELAAKMDPGARARLDFLRSDAKALPFPDDSFDVVFLIDVYEHLYPNEISAALLEANRVLRPGGVLIIHTGPNTWFYKYGYPLIRFIGRRVLGREMPESFRHESDEMLHVNEQNPLSLFRGIKSAGFRPRVTPRTFSTGPEQPLFKRAVKRVLFTRPLGYFFCQSLIAAGYSRKRTGESKLRVDEVIDMMEM